MAKNLKLRPFGNRLLVEPIDPPRTTASGLHLPQGAQREPTRRGTVRAVGPDFGRSPTAATAVDGRVDGVNVGDVVHFAAYSAREVESDGKTFVLLTDSDVMAVEVAP